MLDDTYAQLAAREDAYWWHVARRELIASLFARHGLQAGARVLDIGCGTGGTLAMFNRLGMRAHGVDRSPIALDLAARKVPGATLVRADLGGALPFADGAFAAATILNVLYHRWIDDPARVLREAARVLAPGGLLLVTEPAFDLLSRTMDAIALGQRRFAPGAFAGSCAAAGFAVLRASCITSFGVPAILAIKALERRRNPAAGEHPRDMKPMRPNLNRLALGVARAENRLILAGVRLPVGVTLCVLCRKPG